MGSPQDPFYSMLPRTIYVDDIISGGRTEDEVFKLYATSKKLFHEGGFNLRKFLTNSKCHQEKIDFHESPNCDDSCLQDDQTSETTLGISQPLKMEEHKVLRVPWNPESDRLMFDVSDLAKAAIDLKPSETLSV